MLLPTTTLSPPRHDDHPRVLITHCAISSCMMLVNIFYSCLTMMNERHSTCCNIGSVVDLFLLIDYKFETKFLPSLVPIVNLTWYMPHYLVVKSCLLSSRWKPLTINISLVTIVLLPNTWFWSESRMSRLIPVSIYLQFLPRSRPNFNKH